MPATATSVHAPASGRCSSWPPSEQALAVPLQTSTLRTAAQGDALRTLEAKHFDHVKEFIDAYRSSMPEPLYGD